jgi:hypothetical protein
VSYGVLACPKCGEAADLGVSMPRFSTRPEHAVDRITCRHCGLMVIPEELVLKRHDSVLRGTIPATTIVAPPHVSIGRTARGSGTGLSTDGSGAYQISAGVTVGKTGSTLAVFFAYDESLSGGPISGMTWNGIAMGQGASAAFTSRISCFVLENASAATGAILVDDMLNGPQGAWEFFATEIPGAAVASFDKQAGSSGISTTPSSGNTPATTQAAELLLGAVWRKNGTITGAFSGSFSQGQTATQAGRSLEECYRIVSATGAYAAAKTGCANSEWLSVLATFKEN